MPHSKNACDKIVDLVEMHATVTQLVEDMKTNFSQMCSIMINMFCFIS